MKIDASHVNLAARREFFQEKEIIVKQEVRFSNLFDQRLSQRAIQGGVFQTAAPDYQSWLTRTEFWGRDAVQLTQKFVDELEKIRSLLGMILDRLNSTGLNNCCLDMMNFNNIGLFSGQGLSADLLEVDYIETTRVSYREEESTSYFADGFVNLADGRTIDLSFGMNLDRQYFRQDQFVRKEKGYVLIDPLVVNLNTTIPEISDIHIDFDLNVDGEDESIPILKPGSGFLSLDKNGDGIINDGSELFGPSTGYGFDELAEYDIDQNMWIDENDPIFDELTLWGADEEGQMQLTRIKDAGIGAIYLVDVPTQFDITDEENNLLARVENSSIALNEDGTVSSVQEIDWTA